MGKRFVLGLSISHDASAVLTDYSGTMVKGLAEERLSRVKGHVGLPLLSIARLMEVLSPVDNLVAVVIGSHGNLKRGDADRILAEVAGGPSNPRGKWVQPAPAFRGSSLAPKEGIRKVLRERFPELENANFIWIRHHDAHLAAGLAWSVPEEATLLVSLDGEGDGESGAVAIAHRGKIEILDRFTRGRSLGLMYAEVTQRYNFLGGRHEGKVLGLAATGSFSPAVGVLLRAIPVKNGRPRDRDLPGRGIIQGGYQVLSRLGLLPLANASWGDVMRSAEKVTENYGDLAYAAQRVLEERVESIVRFWIEKTGTNSLVLSGGVFANVLLNQRLSRLDRITRIRIVPDMGDSGLAHGGVLSMVSSDGRGSNITQLNSMFWGPSSEEDDLHSLKKISSSPNFKVEKIPEEESVRRAAQLLASGALVGVHNGSMESGPRALGNRSILADARDPSVNAQVNRRLNRTEFMPLAPVVLDSDFSDYFKPESANIDYRFMTITADVEERYREVFPGVVHVDGTARPQLVSQETNPFVYKILRRFKELTNVGLLVNTSMNVHEQPINYRLTESIELLSSGGIDALVFEGTTIIRTR